jgi:rhodanese-related sulfurtransferase
MTSLNSSGGDVATLTALEAADRLKAGDAVLIDVREADEWVETGVAEPAVLLALSDLRAAREQWAPFLEKNRDKALLLYCRSGGRSGHAAALLAKEGFATANAGGFKAWESAGLPTRNP